MATRVVGPDGRIVEFPAGTPREVMEQAMRQHYGADASDGPTGLGRGIALGGRSTLEGVGSVADFLGTPLRYGLEKLTGIPQKGFTDIASAAADAMGLPKPATA